MRFPSFRSFAETSRLPVSIPSTPRKPCGSNLGVDLDFARLARTATTVRIADVAALAPKILKGEVQGRTVVDVNA